MGFLRLVKSLIQDAVKSQEELVNELSSGVAAAYAEPLPLEERLRALIVVAQRDSLVGSKLSIGVTIDSQPNRRVWMKVVSGKVIDDPQHATTADQQIDVVLREIGFAILAKMGESQLTQSMKASLTASDLRRLDESNRSTRTSLNLIAIDRPALMEALRHISNAKLRLGYSLDELSGLEHEARARQ